MTESFVDPNGRVFEWRGEVYRQVNTSQRAFWQGLFEQGVIEELARDGLLVESEPVNGVTEFDDLIIHHRRVPVVSYCFEWVPQMLRDAALLTLDLCIRLSEKGLTLQDGHPWNILFDGPKPIFIDIGSIVPARDDILWAPYEQFCNFFLFPLYLYAANRDHIARSLLRDYLSGVADKDLLAALPTSFKFIHPRRTLGVVVPRIVAKVFACLPEEMPHRLLSLSKQANGGFGNPRIRLKFLESLRRDIEGLRLANRASDWAGYYDMTDQNYFLTDLSPSDWLLKQEVVGKILTDLAPATVLDVGSNTGQYSKLAVSAGARVTACDLDVASLSLCYLEAHTKDLLILPLVANVFNTSPIPGRGGIACPPPAQRFRSELVMGLALLHHVVASQRLNIDRIVEIFDAVCSRWLLLEFVLPLKPRPGASVIPLLDDYSSARLESCLRGRFKTVTRYPSYPQERHLFLCSK